MRTLDADIGQGEVEHIGIRDGMESEIIVSVLRCLYCIRVFLPFTRFVVVNNDWSHHHIGHALWRGAFAVCHSKFLWLCHVNT